MFTQFSSLFADSSGGSAVVVLLGVALIGLLVITKAVQVVTGIIQTFVQLALSLGVAVLVLGGIGIFAGAIALVSASSGNGY